MSKFDGFTYFGACKSFHYHIINGISQPYKRELLLIKKYLEQNPEKNNTYVDIGGHIGTTALPYSRFFKNVVVYEPNKVNYRNLLKNIQFNKCNNILCKNIGLYNKTIKANILKHGTNSGCFFIKENNNGDTNLVKLDDEDIPGQIDFIKIDTEGSELFILEGAIKTINKFKPLIQIETNSTSKKLFNYDKSKIFIFMKNLGYKIYDDDDNDPIFIYNS